MGSSPAISRDNEHWQEAANACCVRAFRLSQLSTQDVVTTSAEALSDCREFRPSWTPTSIFGGKRAVRDEWSSPPDTSLANR
jgi:hypothetical protein